MKKDTVCRFLMTFIVDLRALSLNTYSCLCLAHFSRRLEKKAHSSHTVIAKNPCGADEDEPENDLPAADAKN
ncbi:hypothetical protein E2L00_09820 [Cedecea colo]|uniref:Uncharacterized protein n=1 Tax=Cedecea colo TaxID=2552946 RepID=A0ABX0VLE6_9ENTR|nr:hypothetical protein [Cedecea colo]